MQFTTYVFLLVFFPISFITYHLICKRIPTAKKWLLIAFSAIFYAYAGGECILWMLASIAINYACVLWMLKSKQFKKVALSLGLLANIGALLYCKYFNFFIENLNSFLKTDFAFQNLFLPLGISFFTFQQIMYLVNVYRSEKVDRFGDYLLYILYFPKILMGPITEPSVLIQELNKPYENDDKRTLCGIGQFVFGLFKKVVIADTFSVAVSWLFSFPDSASSLEILLSMLFYTFEIYFDFSGYSDMAIGISNLFGVGLPINFDSPYQALSIRDFWKRWHISLTSFFTKYLYFPLGGNRKGRLRTYLNILIVFLVSGLWHGANRTFILWGILHGLFSIFDRIFAKWEEKIWKPIRWIFTFAILNITWLLFRAECISQWVDFLKRAFRFDSFTLSANFLKSFSIAEFSWIPFCKSGLIPMIGFVLLSFAVCLFAKNTYKRKFKPSVWLLVLCTSMLILSVISLTGEATFVYLNF